MMNAAGFVGFLITALAVMVGYMAGVCLLAALNWPN